MTTSRLGFAFWLAALAACGASAASARQVMLPPEARLLPGGTHRADLLEVKFRDGRMLRLRDGRISDLGTGALDRSAGELDRLHQKGGEWERAFPEISEKRLEELRRIASARLRRPAPDMNLHFVLRVPPTMDTAKVMEQLAALDIVEHVAPAPIPVPAPTPPDFTSSQTYRNAAPTGIGATLVSGLPGGTGEGVAFADVEYSWNLNHLDLPPVTLIGPVPSDPFSDQNHGTAVLGEIVGQPNGFGVTGIAPDATAYISAANTFSTGFNVSLAILRAVAVLPPGSIILLEQQTGGPLYTGDVSQFGLVPVEWQLSNYNAILTATANGLIVVEAAGNGQQNLDDPIYSTANGGHWPFLPQNDSGAIIVGAGVRGGVANARSRLWFSCYGSTVDLQGWGEAVYTAGYGHLYSSEGANQYYTHSFGGTSGASPIVAGACILLQSYAKENLGALLTSAEIRDLLVATGTPQMNASEHIGPLPNVSAAIASLAPSAPGPFELIAPGEGETDVSLSPVFSWGDSSLAGEYEIVIDDDSDFTSPVTTVGGLLLPLYLHPLEQPLTSNTTFYWKVTASNALGSTLSTPAAGSFTTTPIQPPAPGGFNLVSPGDGATNIAVNLTLQWGAATGAHSYDLLVDDDASFASPAIDVEGIEATLYTAPTGALSLNTRYFWRVTARNPWGGTDSIPEVAEFWTECLPGIPAPGSFNLISPPNGPNISTTMPTLAWGASANADSYTVLIDDSPSLTTPEYQVDGLLGTSHTVAGGALTPGIRYYWGVLARNTGCTTRSNPVVASFGIVLPFCTGDADRSGVVDFTDISFVIQQWGQPGSLGDADNNGFINMGDINAVLANWLRVCPQ
jgi:hypothetical protein